MLGHQNDSRNEAARHVRAAFVSPMCFQHWLPFSLSPDSEINMPGEDVPAKKGFFKRLKDALWKEEDEESKEQQTNKF